MTNNSSRFVVNAPWPRDEVEKLKLWRSAGIGNAEVARRLGRTVHAVTAKVRGLGLTPLKREMPVPHRVRQDRQPEVPRAGKTTLPPLPSLQEAGE